MFRAYGEKKSKRKREYIKGSKKATTEQKTSNKERGKGGKSEKNKTTSGQTTLSNPTFPIIRGHRINRLLGKEKKERIAEKL